MARPDGYRYLKTHEWARVEGEFTYIGLSDYAIRHLSDLVFLDLPDVGQDIMQNEPVGEIESVKAVSDLYAPMTGEVVERNDRLIEELEILKKDPWDEGWMLKVRMEKPSEFDNLLDDAAYQRVVDSSE
ncbi:MAG: glycine cleavage system protein GcvH [Planctomycetota bacterium]|nr:glycine cleavage system protein GcvH [Planctomycetota bacterium]